MKRVFKNILFVILFTLFLSISCKQTTSEPQEPQLKQDTTSHNFIWYVDTFGIHPSFLRDVYIKNENDNLIKLKKYTKTPEFQKMYSTHLQNV
jgi:hypothetical protein